MKLHNLCLLLAFVMTLVFGAMFVTPADKLFPAGMSYAWTMIGILASVVIFLMAGFSGAFNSRKRYIAFIGLTVGLSIVATIGWQIAMGIIGPDKMLVGSFGIVMVASGAITFWNIFKMAVRKVVPQPVIAIDNDQT